MHIIGFNAMKAMGNVQTHYAKCGLALKQAVSSSKTRFMHIIGFKEMKALRNKQTH